MKTSGSGLLTSEECPKPEAILSSRGFTGSLTGPGHSGSCHAPASTACRAARRGCGVATRFEQAHRLLEGEGFGVRTLRHGRICGSVRDVRTVATGEHLDRGAVGGQLLQRLFLRRLTTARLLRRTQ